MLPKTMKPTGTSPQVYEIRIKDHLDFEWQDWFDGLTITQEEGGITQLTVAVADQAALHGLLKKIRDLGLSLISVNRIETNETYPNQLKNEEE